MDLKHRGTGKYVFRTLSEVSLKSNKSERKLHRATLV